MDKYVKTGQMAMLEKTNGGIFYLLPDVAIKVFTLIPLIYLWRVVMSTGVRTNMSMQQMLSYTYVSALLADLMQHVGILFGNRTELWWDHPVIQSYEWKKVVWDIPDSEFNANIEMITELLDMGDLLKTFARELSLGQRMRADLGMMLLHSPTLILLDEPTLGLDVIAKRQMIEFLKRINREKGITIMVTSHGMDDLEEMAQRILMISDGKIAYDGVFAGLRDITGNLTRVSVTMSSQLIPQLENASLINSENRVHEYEIDLSRIPVKELMRQLSGFDDIKDVEIRKAPIEQVIARLYTSWK